MRKYNQKPRRFNSSEGGDKAFEIKKKDYGKLKMYCIWLLSKRSYGRNELGKKLSVYAQNIEDVEKLLDEMEEYKYIDDNQYASSLLKSEVSKGRGKAKIAQVFKNKGVDIAKIDEELSGINWFKQALEIKIKKFGAKVETDQKLKAKQIRYLQYRGFGFDVIMKVVGHVGDEEYE